MKLFWLGVNPELEHHHPGDKDRGPLQTRCGKCYFDQVRITLERSWDVETDKRKREEKLTYKYFVAMDIWRVFVPFGCVNVRLHGQRDLGYVGWGLKD